MQVRALAPDDAPALVVLRREALTTDPLSFGAAVDRARSWPGVRQVQLAVSESAVHAARSTAATPPTALTTANLTLDYAGTAKIGDWLETHVDVLSSEGTRTDSRLPR